jgi:apolipoprotein N-acyltransferase
VDAGVETRPPASLLKVWSARGLAVLAGVAPALAHPPWGLWPGLFGFALIFALVDRPSPVRPLRSSFFRGWLAGCGYFTISLIWLVQPFLIDAKEQAWMAPFALAGVVAGMALFWGSACLLFTIVKGPGAVRVLAFAAALAAFEWLRGHVLTGFPWDLPGEAWRAGSPPSQAAAVVGAYGLTWLTIAGFSSPAVALERRGGRALVALAAIAAATIWAAGAIRLARPLPPGPDAPRLRIVQADVKQETKYDAGLFARIVDRYLALTTRPSARPIDIVVWPEGAIPAAFEDYLSPGSWTADAITAALRPSQTLLVGGYRWRLTAGRPVAYNSLAVIRRGPLGLTIASLYDKHRLVPFGEFIPFDALASRLGVKQFVHVGDGFAAGPRPRPLRLAGLPPVQPLICYESLFPGFTREGADLSRLRPAWIVNVSNDAWFGTASGPRQHLNLASYRAIEEGLPMIRATPTGLSAVIDAFGRTVPAETLSEGAFGVIDAALPPAAPPTLYFRFGDLAFLLMLLVSAAGARWTALTSPWSRR